MRSRAERALVTTLVVVLTACAPQPPQPMSGDPTVSPPGATPTHRPATPAPATSAPTAVPTATAPAVALPEPGRPFDAATLLREMERSTRPGGVPPDVQTHAVAAAIADVLWTYDGGTWDTFAVGGFCGAGSCTVDVAGTRLGASGEDLWVLDVTPADGTVRVIAAELGALPPRLVEELDELAREADGARDLGSMLLTAARWLPPPDGERFVLSYRSGGEEGSCAREITVDAAAGTVVRADATGC